MEGSAPQGDEGVNGGDQNPPASMLPFFPGFDDIF
jgi:hypothetical protein